jgi:O-antigen ligase
MIRKEPRLKGFRVLLFFTFLKPFVDLTWDLKVLPMGAFSLNLLQIFALGVIAWGGVSYASVARYHGRKTKTLIWMFVTWGLITSLIAFLMEFVSLKNIINSNLRVIAGFLIYFVLGVYLQDRHRFSQFLYTVWISVFLVNVLSVFSQQFSNINFDTSQGVQRFAGLYNDAGGPSYNAVIAIIFGSFSLSNLKAKFGSVPLAAFLIYVATILTSIVLLQITITKSALVWLLLFVLLWGLLVKKRWSLIGLVVFVPFLSESFVDKLLIRSQVEINVLILGETTQANLNALGTGRFATWQNILAVFTDQYSFIQKVIGTGITMGAHNQFLAEMMRTGIVGLILFLGVYFSIFSTSFKAYRLSRDDRYAMGAVFLLTFLALGVVGHPFYWTTHFWYLMALLGIPFSKMGYPIRASRTRKPIEFGLRT